MIEWMVSHYAEIIAVAGALLVGLLNLVTPHPDRVNNKVLWVLNAAIDLVSWLQSRESHQAMRGPLAKLKLPGQISPPVDLFRKEPTI